MKISNHFERRDPKDEMSAITYRGLNFETRLSVDCIKKLAQKAYVGFDSHIQVIGIVDGNTRFRVSISEASTSTFAHFMYDVMNWENNSSRQNR